jgi:co-chaperonin GroES (HSP10)
MNKPKDQGNVFYLTKGGKAAVKTRNSKKLNYGQTVYIKNISGSTITVTPDNDNDPAGWAIMDAKDLHNNEMSY